MQWREMSIKSYSVERKKSSYDHTKFSYCIHIQFLFVVWPLILLILDNKDDDDEEDLAKNQICPTITSFGSGDPVATSDRLILQ